MSDNVSNNKVYKGYNGTLIITDSNVTLKRGVKGFLFGGGYLRGDKTIPFSSIVAVQLKKAGLTAGYLQLTLKGGSEAKGGLFQSVRDENTINFYNNKNKDFEEAKLLIEQKISQPNNHPQGSGLGDLEKLADLKDKGVITQEEFDRKKKQLLGL